MRGKQWTRANLSGQIDIGPRTCHWSATCSVSRLSDDDKPKLEELCNLELRIEVFNEAGDRKLGEYEGPDLPDAESKYWTGYVEGLCARKVERDEGVDNFNWEVEE